jgi:hypothetical protein
MDNPQVYKQKFETQLKECSVKLDAIRARSHKVPVDAKGSVQPQIDAAQRKFEAAKAKQPLLARAVPEKWNELKNGADGAMREAKSAIDLALAALDRLKKD